MILELITSLVIHFIMSYVLIYCSDNAKIWKNDKEISVCKPSIYDLPDTSDKHIVNEYIEKVINPAHHYFILRKNIESKQDSTETWLVRIILHLFSLFFVISKSTEVFPNLHLPKFLYLIIVTLACLCVCWLGCYFIYLFYKRNFAIRGYNLSQEDIVKLFVYNKEHGFTQKVALNNYTIMLHYSYLRSIESSVMFRHTMLKMLSCVAAIIYFLCFMQTPN